MKGYKYLVPIALVALMVFSFYSLISNANKTDTAFENYVAEARRLADMDVIEDALENYQKALDLDDSLALNLEVGQMFVDQGWDSYALTWGEQMVDKFPEEEDAYVFLLDCYIADASYRDAFSLNDEAEARGASGNILQERMKSIAYEYEMSMDGFTDVGTFGGGMYPVKKDDLWGYANEEGKREIDYEFSEAFPFNSELVAAVRGADGEYFYISETGNKKYAVQNMANCEGLSLISGNILAAFDGTSYDYYDTDFNSLTDEHFDYATALNGGIGAVQKGDLWEMIDFNETDSEESEDDAAPAEPLQFDGVVIDGKGICYRNERCFIYEDGSFYLADGSGNKVAETPYEDARLFLENDTEDTQALAAVKLDGKWGFINKSGDMVIKPQFDDAHSFQNGYAAIEKSHRWGFVLPSGEMAIEPTFVNAKDFNGIGGVFVSDGREWQMLQLLRNDY